MLIKFGLGMDRVRPPHELQTTQDGFVSCRNLQNYIARDNKIEKIGGTKRYNSSDGADLTDKIPWVHRSYHKRGDGTFRKVAFCFSNGQFYSGNDVAGTLTSRQAGFTPTAIPMHVTMQVSGNSILYVFTGENIAEEPYSYDGNAGFSFVKTSLNEDVGRAIESATIHLDRMWYVSRVSSILTYSTILQPEDIVSDAGDIIVGQDTDSIIRCVIVGANETLYIFKNQSIWQLFGRTVSTFQLRQLTDKYGLASKRTVYPVGSGFVFLNEFDKELYFFGGTEASIQPLTESSIRLREIIDKTQIDSATMTVHQGLFRFAFKHTNDSIYQDRELIYPIAEPGADGLPKWSMIKGSGVLSYSLWNQQGDRDELVTGHSRYGRILYHNRDHNFDEQPIETIAWTKDIVASEDKVARFKGFMVKGKPSQRKSTVTFEYLLDGRITYEGTGALDVSGERRGIASMSIPTQVMFNTRIIPLHKYSLGNSLSFRITDSSSNSTMEIYSISVKAQERYKIRTNKVGL